MTRPRIVIIGAGFGGFAVVRALRRADADLVLVDRTNHHLFQPLLYQVATAALSPADIATATRALLHRQANVRVVMGEVTGIDSRGKRVKIRATEDLPYDYLIIATGAAYSFFGHDEWECHSWVIKTLEDATAIRGRLLGAFEWAESRTDPKEISRLLTFIVVGGGPTGVELAGNIAELSRATLARDFRRIDPASARVIVFEAGPTLLSSFPKHLAQYADAALRSLGVEVRLGTAVTAIDARGLTAGDERIEAANIFWAAGTAARPAAQWLGAAAARNGAVKIAADCTVPGYDNIFAIGDVASQPDATGQPLPGLAAVAKQQGAYVGKLVAARLKGKPPPPPFRYRDLGTMAVIGRSRAVARFPRMSFTGTAAWLLWSLVHLLLLTDFRSRLAVYFNWTWSWFTYGRGARLITDLPRLLRTDGAESNPSAAGAADRMLR
jgi:NADH dehydrogenase